MKGRHVVVNANRRRAVRLHRQPHGGETKKLDEIIERHCALGMIVGSPRAGATEEGDGGPRIATEKGDDLFRAAPRTVMMLLRRPVHGQACCGLRTTGQTDLGSLTT